MDNVKFTSYDPNGEINLGTNYENFIDEVKNIENYNQNALIAAGFAAFGIGVAFTASYFALTPLAPAAAWGIGLALGEAVISTAVFGYYVYQANAAEQTAIKYWNGIP